MARTVLEEMTTVMLAVPRPGASDEEVAAWYELKAHLLERIAAEGGPGTEETARQAVLAHRRSECLRAGDGPDAVVVPITGPAGRRPGRADRSGVPRARRGPGANHWGESAAA
ncbi:MAG TPA: hypothetical protein VFW65_00955 [Pseudonocardiaceae bacterium]|nr:hypothetical protein [Pseudonocardiaceae bacterium]